MNDETLDQELSALLDGELTPERRTELEQRIEAEPLLAARLAELEAVNDSLRGLEPPGMPANLRARLQERIDSHHPAAALPPISNRRVMRWGAPLAAALTAALAAGLVAAWLFLPASNTDVPQIADEREVPASFEEASDDELEIAFELETLRDLELIRDLDLLEALLAIEDAEAQSIENNERG